MKILTTQNLNSLDRRNISTNKTIPNEIRYDFLEHDFNRVVLERSYAKPAVSFRGKDDILPRLAKRIKDLTSKRASDKKGVIEKVLSSERFNRILQFINDNEVITSASIAFLIGWLCRVPTILALPEWLGGKHKEDKAMAAAHSGASVTMGVLTAAVLTLPVNKAARYAREELYHRIKPELLKKRHPQLDLNSIKDSAGKLLEKKFWKNIDGKPFDANVKTPMTVARQKYIGDVAESTFKTMGIDIDMATNASKSVQEMKLRDGRRLIDVLKPSDMFIAVEEEGMGTTLKGLKDTNFFSLEYIDKEFLSKVMPELDINTAFVNGKITHPNQWKTTAGKSAANFDIYISNYLETAESTPIYLGAKRIEGNTQKYVAYQNNGNGGLGTPITNEMILADKNVDTTNKIIGWAIEILTRVPVGLCTVAMIPKILNLFTCFNKEKQVDSKKEVPSPDSINSKATNDETQIADNKALTPSFKGNTALIKDNINNENKVSTVSFKGKGPNKITKWLGENYVLKILNSEKLQEFVEKFDKKFKMSMTEVMTILGSFIISSSYVFGTLTNKNFDKDRKTTLAINQSLGFFVPTALGSWISGKIRPKVKTATYKFVGEQSQRIKLLAQQGKITPEFEKKALEAIAKASKGMPGLASLTVFTFIYRYFTPVAVTPIANIGGSKFTEWRKAKRAKMQTAQA